MRDLEGALRELAREVAFPAEPDVARRVAERLRAEPRRAFRFPLFRRRRLGLALAVLVVAVAAALAVPPVRAALKDLFDIGGVSIERVEKLPEVSPAAGLNLGSPVSLADARARAAFAVQAPDPANWGDPDRVYFSRGVRGGVVSLLYGSEEHVRLLVTEFQATLKPELAKKIVGSRTRIDFVRVRGRDGYWISGAPHLALFVDEQGRIQRGRYRLARNVLLWVEEGVTHRLEGGFDLKTALAIARSLR